MIFHNNHLCNLREEATTIECLSSFSKKYEELSHQWDYQLGDSHSNPIHMTLNFAKTSFEKSMYYN